LRLLKLLACGLPAASIFAQAATAQAASGLQSNVVFGETSPLSANAEILRRMISPLAAASAHRDLARSGQVLTEQSIDPAKENFVVYVPTTKPPGGYGLLVFVPPWRDARMPLEWTPVLDRYGIIYVSAALSGNDANVIGRRAPLALIAYQNIVDRYQVDAQHVYVGGFSGGSRVAMHLALGYPDIFRGALLDAGSDPIGNSKAPLPPRELLLQFQTSSQLVYVSGDQDDFNVQTDKGSMRSMRDWCVTDIDGEIWPHASHDVLGSEAFDRALAALYAPVPPDPVELASCRARIDDELTAQLQQVDALIANGKREDARKLLLEIDTRFGGLAAPQSIALNAELNSDETAH
jgi:dienelactone hydrolase